MKRSASISAFFALGFVLAALLLALCAGLMLLALLQGGLDMELVSLASALPALPSGRDGCPSFETGDIAVDHAHGRAGVVRSVGRDGSLRLQNNDREWTVSASDCERGYTPRTVGEMADLLLPDSPWDGATPRGTWDLTNGAEPFVWAYDDVAPSGGRPFPLTRDGCQKLRAHNDAEGTCYPMLDRTLVEATETGAVTVYVLRDVEVDARTEDMPAAFA